MHDRNAAGPVNENASRPAKRCLPGSLRGQFDQARRAQSQKTKDDVPRPEDAPQTTVLRGHKWQGVNSASGIALDAGTVVRVMVQHAIDERSSDLLDRVVRLDRHSFVFCALHAHMRLTEALVKDFFLRGPARHRGLEGAKAPCCI